MTKQEPNEDKLAELILYICSKCEKDDAFGSVKLNKLLFFADFKSYKDRGKAITGVQYQKLPEGPCPRRFLPVVGKMQEKSEFAVQTRLFLGKTQRRPLALRDADLSLFEPQEIALVDALIEKYWGKTATYLSKLSHKFIGWELAEENEEIPYRVALVSVPELGPKQIKRAQALECLAQECLKRDVQQ